MNDGDSWKVSMPKVCSTTLPTSEDSGAASACVARARQDVGLRLRRVLQRAQLGRDVLGAAADVAEEQRQDVGGRQRRIGVSVGRSCSLVPANATVTR